MLLGLTQIWYINSKISFQITNEHCFYKISVGYNMVMEDCKGIDYLRHVLHPGYRQNKDE